jgi:hypothetical protein
LHQIFALIPYHYLPFKINVQYYPRWGVAISLPIIGHNDGKLEPLRKALTPAIRHVSPAAIALDKSPVPY